MHPYVLRIIALKKKSGKTLIGTKLTRSLKSRGIKIAVIKHVGENIVTFKDTDRYLSAGSDLVIALSHELIATYNSLPGKTLGEIVYSIPFEYRIILVEGFKKENIGDAIAVIKNIEEIPRLVKLVPGLLAIASWNPVKNKEYNGIKIYGFDEMGKITDLVIQRAIEYYHKLLPRRENCGKCGYINCREFVKAYLFGENKSCPLMDRVILRINGKRVHLTEFVKTAMTGILTGFISTLKGTPSSPLQMKEIEIQIKIYNGFFDKKNNAI